MPPTTTIRGPNNILSSPLGQHILDYEPPQGYIMPTFAMFDGSNDPYNHMLHYNQTMTLNTGNDHQLCKVFLTSFQGLTLAWFHRLPPNSVNSFNELWTVVISQYLCSVQQRRNISSLQTIIKQEEETIRRLHQEIRAGHPAGRSLHHGCSPSELQEELRPVHSVLPLIVVRPANYNGRIIQTCR